MIGARKNAVFVDDVVTRSWGWSGKVIDGGHEGQLLLLLLLLSQRAGSGEPQEAFETKTAEQINWTLPISFYFYLCA